jgi:DNA invertase Pin-like site-specific DNA recombinase
MIPPSPSAPLAGARTTTYGKLTTWLGTLEGPALQSLLTDIRSRKVDVVVVYKVDRLTRSLADFAKLVGLFEAHGVSFVAVTQQFNTTSSMGRLTLNVLLSFAQFERELAGERIRDKFAASRRKGMWMGGTIPLGYDDKGRKLVINEEEADRVRFTQDGSSPQRTSANCRLPRSRRTIGTGWVGAML